MTDGVDGILIPIKDQKALEEGINKLIENPAWAGELGMRARSISEKANSQAIFEQWRDFMEACCRK